MATQTSGEKVGEIFAEMRLKFDKLDADFKNMEARGVKSAKNLENSFAKASIRFNDNLLKKSLAEIEQSTIKLRTYLERKIKLGAPLGELEALQSSIDRSENALKKFHREAEKPTNFENASRWGMIATGIQSATMAVRDFYQQMKMVIGQSVNSAADLNVLRAAFKGNAEDLELFKRAVAGTMSEGSLIALSNRATALKLSMEDQAIAFSYAEDKVDEYGGSVAENFDRIVNASEGMGRGLKEIGVETKVYQENLKQLTKEHGGSLEKLDAETQKQIMLKATIMSLGITLDDVKKKQKDQKDLVEAASISVEEARLKLGNFILKGLTPLLKKFDESNTGTKNFITGIVAVGGTIIQAIPIIVQLITAKKLFAIAEYNSAIAVASETTAIENNTIAKAASLGVAGKFAGALSAIGLTALGIGAVGAVVLTLAENIKSLDVKKVEDTANALDQLAKDRTTAKAIGGNVNLNAPSANIQTGGINSNRLILTSQLNNRGSGLISPHLFISQIVSDNKKVTLSVDEVRKRIEALTLANNSVNISWKEYRKNQTEINRLTKSLEPSVNYFEAFEKDKKELQQVNELLKQKNLTDAQRNVLLEKQKELVASIYKYEHPDTAVDLPGRKGLPYKDTNKQEPLGEANYNLPKPDMMAYDEAAKKLHDDLLNTASEFGDALENAFARSGNNFVAYMNQALQVAIRITDILDKIDRGDKSTESGFLGIAATLIGLFGAHSGGDFIGTSSGVIKMAGGGSFIVPGGYPRDSFPLMVETGERVTVTPASEVGRGGDNRGIIAALARVEVKLGALNRNLINKEFNANIFNPIDGTVLVKQVIAPNENSLRRVGVDLEKL